MRKIAIEEHVSLLNCKDIEREIADRLNFPDFGTDPKRHQGLETLIHLAPEEHRIPTMDKYGLTMQVISSGDSFIQSDLNVERATKNARCANDLLYDYIKNHPDRFRAFGIVAMQDPQEAAAEIERCSKELGFVGIMLHGATNAHYYDEAQFEPVWAKLEELDMPLYLHPGNPEADQVRMYEGYPELLASTWNWGVFGGTHALRMVFGGVFERHPGAKLILGHMGEMLPYWLGRLDEGAMHRGIPNANGKISKVPSYYIKNNIYITTSGGYNPEAMMCAVMGMGAGHILFANDYPHVDLGLSMQQVDVCAFLTEEQRDLIYHKNAERLFKI